MYEKYVKRLIDFLLSLLAVVILFPLFVLLAAVGAAAMGGNPFFFQERPGLHGKIFKLVKFRTMTDKKDENGRLLPDEMRLNSYGKFLRSSSLDELPEMINILIGDMSLIGPRPLLVRYLPRYSAEQRRRHDVRPGLTGWAQVNGRNRLSWQEKFELDVWYVRNISFLLDLKIIFMTIKCVFKRNGINSESSATMEEFMGN